MKRLVWGIILIAFGILCFVSAGNNPQGPTGSIIGGFMCLGGGGALVYFGQRYKSRRRSVVDLSFQMLREQEKISGGELAHRLGLSETDVREYILDAQRRGLISPKAEIV